MRCPVCRAENNADSTCRRCKADLSLLVTVDRRRAWVLAEATRLCGLGMGDLAAVHAQEAYHRKRNRYGSLSDMASAQSLFLDVPFQPTSFRRGGYNFEMTTEPDGFRVVAMPTSPNGRPFIGDDSGFIRVGTE